MRVLIVDDNDASREALEERIRAWGAETTSVATGSELLEVLRLAEGDGEPFCAAIIDAELPDLDAVSLGNEIRSDRRHDGTGLIALTAFHGLADSRNLREIGFTASVSKPPRESDLRDALLVIESGGSSTPAPASPVEIESSDGPDHGAFRILLAEDNETNQKVALGILRKFGYTADVVETGREALQALETEAYDLVLMDVQMPEMDGLEATREIRDTGSAVRNHAIPVIAMTAHALKSDRDLCREAGMDDYITKPVVPGILEEVLSRWLTEPGIGAETSDEAPVESTDPEPESAPDFDLAALRERMMNDDDLVRMVCRCYLDEMPDRIASLRESGEAGDAPGARLLAHSIRGASANVSCEAMAALASTIEELAEAGDIEPIRAMQDGLEARFEEARRALAELCESAPATAG